MSDTPRVDAAIGPGPYGIETHEFAKLAAIYTDVMQVARQLECELTEATRLLSEEAKLDKPVMRCPEHGAISLRAVGCPECVVELRKQLAASVTYAKRLAAELDGAREVLKNVNPTPQEVEEAIASITAALRPEQSQTGTEPDERCPGDGGNCPNPSLCREVGPCPDAAAALRLRAYVAENQQPGAGTEIGSV